MSAGHSLVTASCNSRLLAYVVAQLRNPLYASASKHLQGRLTLTQVHTLGVCKQPEL